MTASALILHRSQLFAEQVTGLLASLELSLQGHALAEPAGAVLARSTPELVVVDFADGDEIACSVVRALHDQAPGAVVLAVVTGAGASAAVELMNSGVDDYVLAPPVPADFIARSAYESAQSPPTSPPTKRTVGDRELLSYRLLLEKLVELRGIEPLTLRLPERKKGKK